MTALGGGLLGVIKKTKCLDDGHSWSMDDSIMMLESLEIRLRKKETNFLLTFVTSFVVTQGYPRGTRSQSCFRPRLSIRMAQCRI